MCYKPCKGGSCALTRLQHTHVGVPNDSTAKNVRLDQHDHSSCTIMSRRYLNRGADKYFVNKSAVISSVGQ